MYTDAFLRNGCGVEMFCSMHITFHFAFLSGVNYFLSTDVAFVQIMWYNKTNKKVTAKQKLKYFDYNHEGTKEKCTDIKKRVHAH